MPAASVEHINFRDIDKGLAPFTDFLRTQGFDWQCGKTEAIKGFFQTPESSPQLFFRLPPWSESAEAITEQSIVSDLWSGISESLVVFRKRQPGKLIKVRTMQIDANILNFTVS